MSIQQKRISSKGNLRRHLIKCMAFGLFAAALSPLLPIATAHANSAVPASPDEKASGKTLIVYYSWGGNTRQVVGQMQNTIQADVLELKTVSPYPAEYRPTTVQAKKELQEGFRPPLSTQIGNLESYDNIIIASPNWWGTFAMPVFTFLESADLSGKNVALCITHGGSRLGKGLDDLKKFCPNSKVQEGLAIRDSGIATAQKDVDSWLRTLGLIK